LPLPLPSLAAAHARPPATTTIPTPAGVLRPPVAPWALLPLVPAAVLSCAKLMPEASSRPLANRAIVCFFISRLLKRVFRDYTQFIADGNPLNTISSHIAI